MTAQAVDSYHPMGDPDEVPGSQLQPESVLAIAGIWGVNQRMRTLIISFCSVSGLSASQISKHRRDKLILAQKIF